MTKRLFRSRTDRTLCGVCGGLGEYFDIDPMIFRLLWVVALFCFGGGVLAYLLAVLIIPKKPEALISRY